MGMQTHSASFQFPTLKDHTLKPNALSCAHDYSHMTCNNTEGLSGNDEQNHVFGIMKRQNELTTLLIQQQQLTSLPKREIQIFDGDPLQYPSFIRAFENGIESKSDSYSDCLYYLKQFTRGRPRDLVMSCQHVDPERGYAQAKALLQEHFGDEQMIAAAYMEKA